MTFTVERKIRCLEREIGMRKRVYPSFVLRRKMTQDAADEEIQVLESIKEDYVKSSTDC